MDLRNSMLLPWKIPYAFRGPRPVLRYNQNRTGDGGFARIHEAGQPSQLSRLSAGSQNLQPRQSFSLTMRGHSGIRTHSARVQLLARRKSDRFRNRIQRQLNGAWLPLTREIIVASAFHVGAIGVPLSFGSFLERFAGSGRRCGESSKDQYVVAGFPAAAWRRLPGVFPHARENSPSISPD